MTNFGVLSAAFCGSVCALSLPQVLLQMLTLELLVMTLEIEHPASTSSTLLLVRSETLHEDTQLKMEWTE